MGVETVVRSRRRLTVLVFLHLVIEGTSGHRAPAMCVPGIVLQVQMPLTPRLPHTLVMRVERIPPFTRALISFGGETYSPRQSDLARRLPAACESEASCRFEAPSASGANWSAVPIGQAGLKRPDKLGYQGVSGSDPVREGGSAVWHTHIHTQAHTKRGPLHKH